MELLASSIYLNWKWALHEAGIYCKLICYPPWDFLSLYLVVCLSKNFKRERDEEEDEERNLQRVGDKWRFM